MTIAEIASAIYNDVVGGLRGVTSTPTMSMEQLEDEVIEERLVIIKEYHVRNLLTRKDLMLSIDCVTVDCEYMNKCCELGEKALHFEIPQLVNDLGISSIEFIGSVDRQVQYMIYTDTAYQYHKYKKRNADKPYVYIETTPNASGKYDGFIFNVPFVKTISIIGIFKDPRQLSEYDCCNSREYLNFSILANEIKKRLIEKKLRYYKQLASPITPNDQTPK